MALTVSFTAQQTLGNPNEILFTDTSSGSDGTITSRRIYILLANGTHLVPTGTTTDYIEWSYADSTLTVDCLTQDVGCTLTVEWLNVSNVVVYDTSIQSGFTLYNETFDYGLTQRLTGNPLLINDNGFWEEKSKVRELIDSGNNAIEFASDIFAAQQCYNDATLIRLNSQYIFNSN
jgi:hypothetical protein